MAIMPDSAAGDGASDGKLLQTAANSPAARPFSATLAARKANAKVLKAPKEHHWSAMESDPATGL
jgi:hypothetical protein